MSLHFQFELEQKVNVLLFDTITTGIIKKRIFSETSSQESRRYEVYIESINDHVAPYEDDLAKLQQLSVGHKID